MLDVLIIQLPIFCRIRSFIYLMSVPQKRLKTESTSISIKIDDKYGRRKWEVDEMEQVKQAEEDFEEMVPQESTLFLKARKTTNDSKKQVGKTYVIGQGGEEARKKIFHCDVCELTFNDSLSLVDHQNGKKHNRMLGMNMKVERVSVNDVLQKLKEKAFVEKSLIQLRAEQEREKINHKEDQELGGKNEKDTLIQLSEDEGEEEEEEEEEDLKEMAALGLPTTFGSTKRFN